MKSSSNVHVRRIVLAAFLWSVILGFQSTAHAATLEIDTERDVTLNGETANDGAGSDVYVADINGDGINDLIVGAYQFARTNQAGKVYIVFGPLPSTGTIELSVEADVVISGIDPRDFTGYGVGVGDINNDNESDLIIGASGGDPSGRIDAGETHVVFGPLTAGTFSLSSVSDITIRGISAGDRSGNSVASGDVNNDGFDDVVVGALAATPDGRTRAGESYVLFGPLSSGILELSSSDITINGKDPSELSGFVATGDINNDAIDDLIIGSPNADPFFEGESTSGQSASYETGLVSVLFGPLTAGELELVTASDIDITGIDKFDALGIVKSGDVNNDGILDLLIAANQADPNGESNAGEAYIVLGPLTQTGVFSVATLADDVYVGIDAGDALSGVAAGDVNNDGANDIIIAASQADPSGRTDAGEVYVLFGVGISNQAPVLDSIGNQNVNENQLLEFTVVATDPDTADNLTLSVNNAPAGSTFNSSTGVFSWTPGFNDSGNYTDIEFTVVDDGAPMELDVELITITVGDVNRPPEFSNPGPQEVLEGDLLTFDISATDPDGNTVLITALNTPSAAVFDGETFMWEPTLAQAGVYVVTFVATDNGTPNETATYDVAITVGDSPTPIEQAEDLIEEIVNLDIPLNAENSYLANLHKIQQFITDGKTQPAINQLNAFKNKLAQDLYHDVITQDEYDLLAGAAQDLIDALTEN